MIAILPDSVCLNYLYFSGYATSLSGGKEGTAALKLLISITQSLSGQNTVLPT